MMQPGYGNLHKLTGGPIRADWRRVSIQIALWGGWGTAVY